MQKRETEINSGDLLLYRSDISLLYLMLKNVKEGSGFI